MINDTAPKEKPRLIAEYKNGVIINNANNPTRKDIVNQIMGNHCFLKRMIICNVPLTTNDS